MCAQHGDVEGGVVFEKQNVLQLWLNSKVIGRVMEAVNVW